MKRLGLSLLCLAAAAISPAVAQEYVFSDSKVYQENFRPMPDVSLLQSENGALVARAGRSYYGGALFAPGGSGKNPASLAMIASGNCEVKFSLHGEQGVRTFLQMVARYDEEAQMGVVARALLPSESRLRFQILLRLNPYQSVPGTSSVMLVDWEYDLERGGNGHYREGLNATGCKGAVTGRTIPPGTPLTLWLEQREEPSRAFCVTLLDEAGTPLATTGFQSHEELADLPAQGNVGIGVVVAPGDEVQIQSWRVE